MEDAVEKFAIFGGVGWGKVDTSKASMDLIQELILSDYRYIRNDVSELTSGAPVYHSILTGISMGDGKTHSTFKRAKIDEEAGLNAVEELVQRGIIRVEKSKKVFTSWSENEKIDNKLFFTTPFLRFWFAFVSPLFKGIRDGNYDEIIKRFANREAEFVNLTYIELSHELLKLTFVDDKIKEISSYWDREIELDIYATTTSGKIVVGSCKYTNAKVKKSELKRLEELCEKAGIKADVFVIVSKNGFSNELKTLKGENLKLLSLKNFKKLAE
ncbi:hypothetical protein GJV85_01070 [Sulfurimonas aquatica]|uniref:DUF234 domain-containing protein n=1 Tax=Sulfurimonas aquatica TaxID=2672570 RepID=A0A975AYD7_9BACT|nr:DUF234 domain-containing protein [Sulfurimonas aquatica]QSZ40765.1 hypothetical protein GJV85_01070 [Sulfurimonas aquatica]